MAVFSAILGLWEQRHLGLVHHLDIVAFTPPATPTCLTCCSRPLS